MKEGGHWPPSYFSLGTSLGPTGGISLQPSCSENGGFLDSLPGFALLWLDASSSVKIPVNFSMFRYCQ